MAKQPIDLSDPKALSVVQGASVFPVVAIWDSGVGPQNVIAIVRGGGLFQFDPFGVSLDPNTILSEEITAEWAPATDLLPKITVGTNASGILVFTLTWPQGDVEKVRAAVRVAPGINLPASLSDRRVRLLGRA